MQLTRPPGPGWLVAGLRGVGSRARGGTEEATG